MPGKTNRAIGAEILIRCRVYVSINGAELVQMRPTRFSRPVWSQKDPSAAADGWQLWVTPPFFSRVNKYRVFLASGEVHPMSLVSGAESFFHRPVVFTTSACGRTHENLLQFSSGCLLRKSRVIESAQATSLHRWNKQGINRKFFDFFNQIFSIAESEPIAVDSLLVSPAKRSYAKIEMCTSLYHGKKMKADPSRLIPRKPTENLELLFVQVRANTFRRDRRKDR